MDVKLCVFCSGKIEFRDQICSRCKKKHSLMCLGGFRFEKQNKFWTCYYKSVNKDQAITGSKGIVSQIPTQSHVCDAKMGPWSITFWATNDEFNAYTWITVELKLEESFIFEAMCSNCTQLCCAQTSIKHVMSSHNDLQLGLLKLIVVEQTPCCLGFLLELYEVSLRYKLPNVELMIQPADEVRQFCWEHENLPNRFWTRILSFIRIQVT